MVTYTYEPGRNVITSITNEVGALTVSAYTYTNNAIGQRTARSQSGTAFAASASEIFRRQLEGEEVMEHDARRGHRAKTLPSPTMASTATPRRSRASSTDYTANLLESIHRGRSGMPATPTYDDDGPDRKRSDR